jgi:hypothetical protein
MDGRCKMAHVTWEGMGMLTADCQRNTNALVRGGLVRSGVPHLPAGRAAGTRGVSHRLQLPWQHGPGASGA